MSWRESHATSTAPSTSESPRTAQVSQELAAEEAAGPAASTVHGCPRPAGPVRTTLSGTAAVRPASAARAAAVRARSRAPEAVETAVPPGQADRHVGVAVRAARPASQPRARSGRPAPPRPR